MGEDVDSSSVSAAWLITTDLLVFAPEETLHTSEVAHGIFPTLMTLMQMKMKRMEKGVKRRREKKKNRKIEDKMKVRAPLERVNKSSRLMMARPTGFPFKICSNDNSSLTMVGLSLIFSLEYS